MELSPSGLSCLRPSVIEVGRDLDRDVLQLSGSRAFSDTWSNSSVDLLTRVATIWRCRRGQWGHWRFCSNQSMWTDLKFGSFCSLWKSWIWLLKNRQRPWNIDYCITRLSTQGGAQPPGHSSSYIPQNNVFFMLMVADLWPVSFWVYFHQ